MKKISGRKAEKTSAKTLCLKAIRIIFEIYAILLLGIYPLCHGKTYADTSSAKWSFYKGITWYLKLVNGEKTLIFPGLLSVLIILVIAYRIMTVKSKKIQEIFSFGKLSQFDICLGAYLIFAFVSLLLSGDISGTLQGYKGWYMGFLSQLAFVLTAAFASRVLPREDIPVMAFIAAGSASIVFAIALLNRLSIDPLSLLKSISTTQYGAFTSTMGQTSWYSGYLILIVPLGLYFYHSSRRRGGAQQVGAGGAGFKTAAAIVFLILCSMAFVSNNSDSAFVGFLLAAEVLLYFSFDNAADIRSFVEIVLIMLFSFVIFGFIRRLAGEGAVALDAPSEFLMNGWIAVLALAAGILYVVQRKKQRVLQGADLTRYRGLRKLALAVTAAASIILIIYIALNTAGLLPESVCTKNSYLYFDNSWGHFRGAIWKDTIISYAEMIKNGDLKRILFGYGPDSFYRLIEGNYSADVRAIAGAATGHETAILTNAHNEFATAIVNFGILGGTAYIAIFIAALKDFFKNVGKEHNLIACAMCVASYIGFNLFCYQQYMSTPYVFLIMGIGERYLRPEGELKE